MRYSSKIDKLYLTSVCSLKYCNKLIRLNLDCECTIPNCTFIIVKSGDAVRDH